MLIDDKTDIYKDGQVQTVWNFLCDHVKQGNFDIVSGFFSIAGLHALYTELNPDVKYRLIFSEMTRDDDFMNKVLGLLQGDSSIEATLQLSDYAKKAKAPFNEFDWLSTFGDKISSVANYIRALHKVITAA